MIQLCDTLWYIHLCDTLWYIYVIHCDTFMWYTVIHLCDTLWYINLCDTLWYIHLCDRLGYIYVIHCDTFMWYTVIHLCDTLWYIHLCDTFMWCISVIYIQWFGASESVLYSQIKSPNFKMVKKRLKKTTIILHQCLPTHTRC